MNRSTPVVLLCAVALQCCGGVISTARAAPDPAAASALFAEADTICRRDGGTMWGVSLCGPLLLVDYTDLGVVANAPDAEGHLREEGGLYVGTLPTSVIVANTPTEWAGVRWTQLVSILPEDTRQLHVLIAHELFHRIQPSLGLVRQEADNGHLDSFDGRYLLQLEWRALARALQTEAGPARVGAVTDAVAFRRERYRLFPQAAANEAALDTNEGIPEYTGVMLGLETQADRIAYALHDLAAFVDAPSFVRAFAYAHGPAYGLLLDDAAPGWFRSAATGPRFDELLEMHLELELEASDGIATRAARYDGDGALRAREQTREQARQAVLAGYRSRLVDGPVVVLPMANSSLQFNPQTLIPLPDLGTVYPTLQLNDRWGTLVVESGGALVQRNPRQSTVSAAGFALETMHGDGWRLTLKSGWHLRPGDREGDWIVDCKVCEPD